MLKNYQQRVVRDIESFFSDIDSARQKFAASPDLQSVLGSPINVAFVGKYEQFQDRPKTGANGLYPRVCIKMPTGGGKTLVAIEAIRSYQNLLAKKRTGLVVWITHRDQIYRQTIENLQNKSHPYRQLLDQASGNRTLIIEKGQSLRQQDVQENLVVLMLMIQSATRDTNKIFEDSGGYMDFFPPENRYDLHAELLKLVPNLDRTEDSLFDRTLVKTSLGNVIRTLNPFIIVDEFHTMWTDIARSTLDGLNATAIMGLSATPKRGMNILSTVTGKDLKAEDMIKLDMHLIPPIHSGDWRTMIGAIKTKRDDLQKKAKKLEQNNGTYIRPIALIQVERTGKDQRGQGLVHSEDVRELLIDLGVPKHEIAVKSSSIDEIKQQKLLSRESEIRYIITKEALK
jgi:type III restriction enzyme